MQLILPLFWFCLLTVFSIFIFTQNGKKINILNVRYLFIELWLLIIFLYNLKLSILYHPSYMFSIILLIFLIAFYVFTGMIKSNSYDHFRNIYQCTIDKIEGFRNPMIILFIIGLAANYYEYTQVGLPIFLQNKVNRGEVIHYARYLTNLTSIAISLAYVYFRIKKGFLPLFIMVVGIASLVVWLNRGSLFLFFIMIAVYELFRSQILRTFKKALVTASALAVVFVLFFGYIGNLRMDYVLKNIYKQSVNYRYGMSEIFPSELVHVYMYASSPLENARHMMFEQEPKSYHMGVDLVYPFIAPLVKKFGIEGENFDAYLDKLAGLNVSSFIQCALLDFGITGVLLIYPLTFAIVCLFIAVAINKFNEFTILVFASGLHLFFWSIFISPFNDGTIMIDLLFCSSLYMSKRIRLFGKQTLKKSIVSS